MDYNGFKWNIWQLLLFLMVFGNINALTGEESKAQFIKNMMKCMKTHPEVTLSDMISIRKLIVPTKTETKCLMACAYKLTGMMTKDGRYDLVYAQKMLESYKGDEKKMEKATKMTDICSKVNEIEVSDGESGCERAALMFKCVVENAPKLGIKL